MRNATTSLVPQRPGRQDEAPLVEVDQPTAGAHGHRDADAQPEQVIRDDRRGRCPQGHLDEGDRGVAGLAGLPAGVSVGLLAGVPVGVLAGVLADEDRAALIQQLDAGDALKPVLLRPALGGPPEKGEHGSRGHRGAR